MQNFEGPVLESRGENKKVNKKSKKVWIIAGVVLVVLILGFLAWRFGMSTNLGGKVSKVFPLPVAKVGNGFVMSTKMNDNFEALKFFYDSQEGQTEKKLSDLEIKKMVLDRLIEDGMIKNCAEKYNIKVTSKDIEEEYKYVLEDYDSEDELAKEIKSLYNMNISDFKKEILVPSLYYDKLQTAYLMDDKVDPERKKKSDEAKKKAEEALAKLKEGKDFAELAKEVSEDNSTKKEGGDLGFFGKEEMDLEFEQAAFALNEGEISDLVRTTEGWQIIKLEKKKGSGDDEQVKASHILFKVKDDFDKWFLEQKKKAKVKIYLKDITWDNDQAMVAGLGEVNDEELSDEDIEIEDVEIEPVK